MRKQALNNQTVVRPNPSVRNTILVITGSLIAMTITDNNSCAALVSSTERIRGRSRNFRNVLENQYVGRNVKQPWNSTSVFLGNGVQFFVNHYVQFFVNHYVQFFVNHYVPMKTQQKFVWDYLQISSRRCSRRNFMRAFWSK